MQCSFRCGLVRVALQSCGNRFGQQNLRIGLRRICDFQQVRNVDAMDKDEDDRIIQQIRDAQVEGDFLEGSRSRREHESIDVDVIVVEDEEDEVEGIGEAALAALEAGIMLGYDEIFVIDLSDVVELEEDELVGIGAAALAALEAEILNGHGHDENEVMDVSDESDESLAVVMDENEVQRSFTSSDFVTDYESEQEDSLILGEFLTDDEGWDGFDEDLLYVILDTVEESDVQAAVFSLAEVLVAQQEAAASGQLRIEYEMEEQMLDPDPPLTILEPSGLQQMPEEIDADLKDEAVDDFELGAEHFPHGNEVAEQSAEADIQFSDELSESDLNWLYEIEIDECFEIQDEDFDTGDRESAADISDEDPRISDDDEDEDEIDR